MHIHAHPHPHIYPILWPEFAYRQYSDKKEIQERLGIKEGIKEIKEMGETEE